MGQLPADFPDPRIPEQRDAPPLSWGILAPGWIATQFVSSLQAHTSQLVSAVASRSPERAASFASAFGIDRVHASYDALVADPDVDIVYVAAPQSEHQRLALLAIEADKHVLVEKPFTTTATEAREVVDRARARKVFAMEAMWTRYLPQSAIMARLIDDGVLGDIRLVCADHGQLMDPGGRLYRPELGGGALLDLGIYPVSFAFATLGEPARVAASGSLTPTGVDAQSVLTLDYAGGAQAVLHTTLMARTPTTASVSGSKATLEVHPPFSPDRANALGLGLPGQLDDVARQLRHQPARRPELSGLGCRQVRHRRAHRVSPRRPRRDDRDHVAPRRGQARARRAVPGRVTCQNRAGP